MAAFAAVMSAVVFPANMGPAKTVSVAIKTEWTFGCWPLSAA
jgi:hypothetical protein